MTTESVNQRGKSITPRSNQQAIQALLVSIQADLTAIRTFLATHTHASNGAVASQTPAALNTQP
jgi:hypothetical protein